MANIDCSNLDLIQREAIRLLAYVERMRHQLRQGEQPDDDLLRGMRLSADSVKTATFLLKGQE